MVVGNQADEERDQDGNRHRGPGVGGKRLQRHDDEQEDQRQHREQDVQGDLVRRPLARDLDLAESRPVSEHRNCHLKCDQEVPEKSLKARANCE